MPSPAARDRFSDAVGREVDELRDGLADELLFALLSLDDGEVDDADRLLGASSERLRRFQEQMEQAIAAAAVEREAEAIVAAAEREEAGERPVLVRLAASTVAAAVAIVGGLFVATNVPDVEERLVAGAQREQATEAESAAVPSSRRAGSTELYRGTRPAAGETPLAATGDAGVLRFFESRSPLLARFADRAPTSPLAALLGVERLVTSLVPPTPLGDVVADLEIVESRRRQQEPQPEPEPQPAQEPAEQPAEEPAPSESNGEPESSETPSDPFPVSEPEGEASPEPTEDDSPEEQSTDDGTGGVAPPSAVDGGDAGSVG